MSDTAASAVSIAGLTKHFGSLEVLTRLDLEIEAGSFVSIVGPSGCGKSTLLRIVAGLEPASGGEVLIDGRDPAAARHDKRIAFVPQQAGLFPWRTVRDNARLLLAVRPGANPVTHPDPVELLGEVGLGDFLDAYPHELSGGMQQRVALVRGFAIGAPLLLMDEPFGALDEITRSEMRNLLARLIEIQPATVVFVTHSIAEAVYLSDRVLALSPRPARVTADLAVGIARPRRPEHEDLPVFAEHSRALRQALRLATA